MSRFHLLLLLLVLSTASLALEPGPAITVTPLLKTTTSWDGTPLHFPEGQAEITGVQVEIAPGGETGWHLHPAPSFGMVLDGELTVMLMDGRSKTLKRGDSVAEVVNTLHNGRNMGKTPVRLLVFYAGAVGQTLTQRETAAP